MPHGLIPVPSWTSLLPPSAVPPRRKGATGVALRARAGVRVAGEVSTPPAPPGSAYADPPRAPNASSPAEAVTLLVDALNNGDAAFAAALFASDATLLQARAQIWVDQETGLA